VTRFGRQFYLLDLKITSSASGLQVGKVRTRLSRFVLETLTWWKFCKDSDFRGLSMEVLEDISSKCLVVCLIGHGRFRVKIGLDQKMAGEASHRP
jgi:hypothetical protein